ncbi:hypothetical protein LBMAG56_50970 [Verrucomicrobiota bacterium]|nr:hypothetical protein LBMAG56_50970 [Verrucomicrobiota bacterium]
MCHKCAPILKMKKEPKKVADLELLNLLKQVLPKATTDPKLAGKIYQAIEAELKTKAKAAAFEKFCAKVALPNLEPKTLADVKTQLAASFGDGDVTIKPNRAEKTLAIEVALPDGGQFRGEVKVNPDAVVEESDEQEIVQKFVACPVALPGDPELIWVLGKRESMNADEAGIALAKVEEEFWASKAGQKLLRDRVDRSFPEFISRVPAGMLTELGLKRHYKLPEAIKVLRPLENPIAASKPKPAAKKG